ncbi:serine proteinase inhibitor [Opisthorchis viverrini]|uniref:Serine proteinase inhibitor n=1 Tax=Opisthorchis viverrini TaxID=6198 RepID=A0A1S8WJZ9_OPIVI|nr:serine proteinase inhibitor [Opisthorchis viverrini]
MQAKEMEQVLHFKEGLTEFAGDIYDKIIKLQAASLANSLFSPMSVYCASLLMMAGVDGETLQEMQQVLHIPPKLRSDAVHQSYGPIISEYFEASSDVDLNLANRLYLLKSIDIRPEYGALVAKCYKASVELITELPDLEAKRLHINAWVAKNTKDKIEEFLPPNFLDDSSIIILVNALYFRENRYSSREAYNNFAGRVILNCLYNIGQKHRSAFHPLMITCVKLLQVPGQLASALRGPFHMEESHLFLPKFKLADQPMIDLKPILYECGMKKLFDGGDLSRLSQSRLSVSNASHKAVLELDEEGVTAAAATIFTMCGSCRLLRTISVDHPFFFALVCDSTTPVFVGHVVTPKFD